MLQDGRRIRLQGLALPDPAVCPEGAARALQQFLAERLVERKMWAFPEVANRRGDDVDLTAVLRRGRTGPSVNEAALAAGLAVLRAPTPEVRELAALRAAAARAQASKQGWFARQGGRTGPMPFFNGAVLGLHYQRPRYHYHRQLDELAAAGFRHVCLLLSVFVADAEANEIDRGQPRTVTDARLIETIDYAKSKGMTVLLLPIVLLQHAAEDDWRGTLRPSDPGAFWLSYDDFLCHYLDIAEACSADAFSIGSELGSLEGHTEVWRRLIAHARGRFRGWLTYSANWDHVHVPRFFGELDYVGLTGYFALTGRDDPSQDQLDAGWRRVAERLQRALGPLGKPVVFTELGYPSQDGCNREPWNYSRNRDRIDLAEQEQCFAAFLSAVPSMPFLRGAYFYDYFDPGGEDDPGYSPRGKPAFEVWKTWARRRD